MFLFFGWDILSQPAEERVILIGDAAGLAKPTTGGGIGPGIKQVDLIVEELSKFEGLTPSMLVKLGNVGVKTVDDLADLSSDELKEALEEITLSNKEADEIIMSARSSWFDDDKKEENNEEN